MSALDNLKERIEEARSTVDEAIGDLEEVGAEAKTRVLGWLKQAADALNEALRVAEAEKDVEAEEDDDSA